MSRSSLYCNECGARLTLFVVGVCERCTYDFTGEDTNRTPLEGTESDSKEEKCPRP